MTDGLPLADELTAVYARMSGLLLTQETTGTTLQLVTTIAKDTVHHSCGAGATLVSRTGAKTSAGFTDVIVQAADTLQYELDEGPCLTAWAERRMVRIDDTAEDGDWARWRHAALDLGLRSCLSTPMVAEDRAIGAIKVYANEPAAFSDHDERLLALLADQAAAVLANVQAFSDARRISEDLKGALRSRDVINIAKGVLMEREGLDEHAAFDAIVAQSRAAAQVVQQSAETYLRDAGRRVHRQSR